MSIHNNALAHLPPNERILPFADVPGVIRGLGQAGMCVFLVQGVFDIIHAGHAGLIKAVRQLEPANSVVMVGLENDETVRRNKGSQRPVNPLADRLAVVAEFRSVTFAFAYEDTPRYDVPTDYYARWDALRPDAVVVSKGDPNAALKEWQAYETGTRIAYVDYQHENSTSRMLRAVGYEF